MAKKPRTPTISLDPKVSAALKQLRKMRPPSDHCPGHEDRIAAHIERVRQDLAEADPSRRIYSASGPRRVIDLKPEKARDKRGAARDK